MSRSVGLLLGLAFVLLAAQTAQAGCFPSLVDLLANKFESDTKTVFTVTRQDGAPLTSLKLCPGMTYNVHIEFPDPRTYFLMGTKGFFKGLLPSLTCPNQMTNNQSSTVTSFDMPFTVSCDVKGFSVWGIASMPKAALLYKFLNISMPLLDLSACPSSFCLKNNTSNYTGSITGNNTIAAYGQCGGAGGECANYNFCADAAFPRFQCVSGWSCQRQHRWYYQCLPATSIVSSNGCDFSFLGEPWATMLSGLGMICSIKSGIVQFALNPLGVPKLIDPFAMLSVFSGLAALKTATVAYDPVSLLTSFKQLCDMVPTSGNSTQAVMVAGMSKFLTVMTTKVLVAGGNSTTLSNAAIGVLASMGGAAYSGSYADLTKTFSLTSMLSVVSSFGTLLTVVKQLNIQF